MVAFTDLVVLPQSSTSLVMPALLTDDKAEYILQYTAQLKENERTTCKGTPLAFAEFPLTAYTPQKSIIDITPITIEETPMYILLHNKNYTAKNRQTSRKMGVF